MYKNVKNILEEKISSLSMCKLVRYLTVKKTARFPHLPLLMFIDNEIEFHEQVFPQSDNNEIQNELDSETGMLLDYENDILSLEEI